MNLLETVDFHIVVTGDRTGEKWVGNFKAFRRLSHRQELARDRFYRDLLGPNPEGASERAVSQAEIFADLKVTLADTPRWWKDAGEGLDLADDNLIQEVWQQVVKIRLEAFKEVQEKAEEAEKKLKEVVENE